MALFYTLAQATATQLPAMSQEQAILILTSLLVNLLYFLLIFGAIVFIYTAFCMMSIFAKAGVKRWVAWVPFYSTWKLLELGDQKGWLVLLAPIPVVNIVMTIYLYIAMYRIGLHFGKEKSFVVWAIVAPWLWFPWLAFDQSVWKTKIEPKVELAPTNPYRTLK